MLGGEAFLGKGTEIPAEEITSTPIEGLSGDVIGRSIHWVFKALSCVVYQYGWSKRFQITVTVRISTR